MKFTLTIEKTVTYEPDFQTMEKIVTYATQNDVSLEEALDTLIYDYSQDNHIDIESSGLITDEYDEVLGDVEYEDWSCDYWNEEETSDFVFDVMIDKLGYTKEDAMYFLGIDEDEYEIETEDDTE